MFKNHSTKDWQDKFKIREGMGLEGQERDQIEKESLIVLGYIVYKMKKKRLHIHTKQKGHKRISITSM